MKTCLSCKFLQGGLTLWPDNHMTPCCLGIYNDLKASQLSMPSNKNYFDIRAWRKLIDSAHLCLEQGNIPTECQGCPQLQEFPVSDSSIPFFSSVNIINSRKCNLACTFCYLKKEFCECDSSFEPHTGMFQDLVAKGLINAKTMIYWGGGEPALHPCLKELYALFDSAGSRQHFDTNATTYMPFLEKNLALGRVTLSCSLMTPNPDTYKNVMGRDLCEQAWQNAKRYAATGGDVRGKFIMLPENTGQEESFVVKCKAYGISILNLDREIYTINTNSDIRPLFKRVFNFMHAASALGCDLIQGVGLTYLGQSFSHDFYEYMTKMEKANMARDGVKVKRITLRLQGKNQNAVAGQVFLLGVLSDVEPIADMRRLGVKGHTTWSIGKYSYFSGEHYYFSDSVNSSLSFEIHYMDKLGLRFISSDFSGIINILIDDRDSFIIDLYETYNKHLEIDVLNKKIISHKRIF